MRGLFQVVSLAALTVAQGLQVPLVAPQRPSTTSRVDGIPLLGFGTWNLKEKNTSEAVSWAIQSGYRHIDCAAIYGNEQEVGAGIADGLQKTGLTREDLWITSKLWNDRHSPELVHKGIASTLDHLGVGYLDLYHMHWPVASPPSVKKGNEIEYLSTWDAMTNLVEQNLVRYIGVSNFSPVQLVNLLNYTHHPPAVHQMELHPYLPQTKWLAFHARHGIHVTAYSPLAGTNPTYDETKISPVPLLNNKQLKKIAKKRGCTSAQVALAWGAARGTSVIPKSIHADHIVENLHSLECPLEKKDLQKIDKLGKYHHRYNNPSKTWSVHLYHGLEDWDGKGHHEDFDVENMQK